MRKLTQLAATLAVGAACALPVLAQDTGSPEPTHGNTGSQGVSTTPQASTPTPPGVTHTISASDTSSMAAPSTNTMGAGPQDRNSDAPIGDRDIGWLGLLGLFGLLGLRRRPPEHDGADLRHGSAR